MATLAVLVVAGGLGWLWLRSRRGPDAGSGQPAAAGRPADQGPSAVAPAEPPLDLPALAESDPLVRELVGQLSAHPRLAAWLVSDDLIHHFVVTVVRLAGGASPRPELRFMEPQGEFAVREEGGRLFIDAASYRRYDIFTQVFLSLDTEGSVRLYEQLHPLFEEEYSELGFSDPSFDQTFEQAVNNLLGVEVPDGPVEVWQDEAVYAFQDPGLEALSDADKQLIRMGPENARLFQGKLGEIAEGLGIPRPEPF